MRFNTCTFEWRLKHNQEIQEGLSKDYLSQVHCGKFRLPFLKNNQTKPQASPVALTVAVTQLYQHRLLDCFMEYFIYNIEFNCFYANSCERKVARFVYFLLFVVRFPLVETRFTTACVATLATTPLLKKTSFKRISYSRFRFIATTWTRKANWSAPVKK